MLARVHAQQEFLGNMGHELHAPLGAIRGALGTALGQSVTPTVAELLAVAATNAERLDALLVDMLDMDRIATGTLELQLEAVDVDAVVHAAHAEVAEAAARCRVQVVLPEGQPERYVHADYDRLLQVLTNLLADAIERSPHPETIDVNIASDLERVVCRIRSRGVAPDLKRPSPSNDSTQGGLVFSLRVADAMVGRLGGVLDVRPRVSGGFEYVLELPRLDATKARLFGHRVLLVAPRSAQALHRRALQAAGLSVDVTDKLERVEQELTHSNYKGVVAVGEWTCSAVARLLEDLRSRQTTAHVPFMLMHCSGRDADNDLLPQAYAIAHVRDWVTDVNASERLQAVMETWKPGDPVWAAGFDVDAASALAPWQPQVVGALAEIDTSTPSWVIVHVQTIPVHEILSLPPTCAVVLVGAPDPHALCMPREDPQEPTHLSSQVSQALGVTAA